jgi:GT2 family glycosyltransferase
MNHLVDIVKSDSRNALKDANPPRSVLVSVIMVVYHTGPALRQSLDLVLADPMVDEFVVVDNGSPPQDVAHLKALALSNPRLRLVQGHGNIGFGQGANLGAEFARGRGLVFLNPDAYLQPGCISALIAATKDQASPCIVGARVINHDGTEQRGARRGEVTPLSTFLSLSHLATRINSLSHFEIHRQDEPLPLGPVAMPTISGACFYMSRFDFQIMGGFDKGYFLHVEDIDLCWRVRSQGGSVVFQPLANVIHLGSTSQTNPVMVEFWKGLGLARYFRKRSKTIWQWLIAVLMAPAIVCFAVMRPALRRL